MFFHHRCEVCGRGLLFKHKQRGAVQYTDCRREIMDEENERIARFDSEFVPYCDTEGL